MRSRAPGFGRPRLARGAASHQTGPIGPGGPPTIGPLRPGPTLFGTNMPPPAPPCCMLPCCIGEGMPPIAPPGIGPAPRACETIHRGGGGHWAILDGGDAMRRESERNEVRG
eukprot:1895186-Prymnesium_polylepis.1